MKAKMLLSEMEVAERLGISQASVRRMRQAGLLQPVFMRKNIVKYVEADIAAFVDRLKAEAMGRLDGNT